MPDQITVDRLATSSKIFHIRVLRGNPPTEELLGFGEVGLSSSNPNVVKVFALSPSGQPISHQNDGAFAVVYSAKTGPSKSGRFMMLFVGNGKCVITASVRHRQETPSGTAGDFTGQVHSTTMEVTVASANPKQEGAPIVGIRIVEGEP